ncbi:hypothetical protein LTR97_000210 [Elasticomyces elasticus]|uniref:BTB domain-containing protein n=1 Tax=Elasticomyces elasticus TaxID=574655 RepID=A0AAN7ZQT7_9PEZI|nr:hypothetical protein LTR97_000210 [Elasticomyces elasticus]
MEAKEKTVPLREDEPAVIDGMLRYLYTSDYSDTDHYSRGSEEREISPIVYDVLIHIAADKYDIPALQSLAASKFNTRAQEEWKLEAFADAAELIYTAAADRDHQLRNTVVAVATKHGRDLSTQEQGSRFREVAASVGALGAALWQMQIELEARRPKPLDVYSCSQCAKRTTFVDGFQADATHACPYCTRQQYGSAFSKNAALVKGR